MRVTAFLSLGLVAAANAADQPKLPPPFATPSVTNRPKVIEKPASADLKVPAAFKIELFAEGFERPRLMIYGPSKEILLSDSGDQGSVWILKPQRKKLIENLDR